jgi:peptidyl-tRNA hydrolase
MNVIQTIVIRRDLQMSPGLLAAQVAHLSSLWLHRSILVTKNFGLATMSEAQRTWLDCPVLGILAVNIPEELSPLIQKAKELEVKYYVWKDTIPSRIFGNEDKPRMLHVEVGVAFGPDDNELIKQITGELPRY